MLSRVHLLARFVRRKPAFLARSFSAKGEISIPGVRADYGSLGDYSQQSTRDSRGDPEANLDAEHVTQNAIIRALTLHQASTIESVVPWFLENMPTSYFRQVPEVFRMGHIKAVAAVKDANMDLYLNLKSHLPDNRHVLTYIRPGTEPGTLLKMVSELPWRQTSANYLPLTRLHVFSTKDESMSLNMFVYGAAPASMNHEAMAQPILDYAAKIVAGNVSVDGLEPSELLEQKSLADYVQRCSDSYIRTGVNGPSRFLQQRILFDQVSGTEGTAVNISPSSSAPGCYWVDVAVANSLPQTALEHLCRLLFIHNFDVTRARLDVLSDDENGNIAMLRMLVAPLGDNIEPTKEEFEQLSSEMKRVKWLDPEVMDLVFDKYNDLTVVKAEIVTALCTVMHPILAKKNNAAYSKSNIYEAVTHERSIGHASAIAELFLDRFHPQQALSEKEFQHRCDVLRKAIENDVEDSMSSELLQKMIEIVDRTLRTNVYMPDRYALGLRLDPQIMQDEGKVECPYGIFFVHGRRFNGFHVRFRDISRGGMRLVTPKSPEQYSLESARHYDECYELALAQQLKNKDIPEGGGKAVCLIDTNGFAEEGREFVVRKSVKAFSDAILDLIVETEETKAYVVDLFGKKEVLYFGPDEQVIPEDIDWIVRRAGARGYTTPAAFMSSKPRAGINHKEYGVTSEGVNVYLDVALNRTLGINPRKQPFTIKITGGPDGDVAGNELLILMREYRENAKIVGIADASGCCEDPSGLDHDELHRLVKEGLSIDKFNSSKLGSGGVRHVCDNEDGIKARNTMHNRLQTDAFVPCGGRPGTMNLTNYKQFMLPDGTPSSKLIVEGANLFITSEARQALYDEAGVAIVKDSSANKGGVITSSYEICAAMLCSEEEFFENKSEIVSEVLGKLRGLAKLEAELLFREHEMNGGSLPNCSEVISDSINLATDALSAALDSFSDQDLESLLPLFRAHLPPTLANLSFEHVHDRVPAQYIKNAIGSCLASKLVYKEGTRFIAAQDPEKLAQIALRYLEKEKEVAVLIESLKESSVPDDKKQKILELLERGGARTALNAF